MYKGSTQTGMRSTSQLRSTDQFAIRSRSSSKRSSKSLMRPLQVKSKRNVSYQEESPAVNVEALGNSTSQLHLLTEELETLTKEKKALQEIVEQLKREIKSVNNQIIMIKKNHERLHNEAVKIHRATNKLENERIIISRDTQNLEKESKELEISVQHQQEELQDLRQTLDQEQATMDKLESVISRMKKELSLQLKERDAFRGEAFNNEKQNSLMESKIEEIKSKNRSIVRKINFTVSQIDNR
jgi:chromosome segregation ATPase